MLVLVLLLWSSAIASQWQSFPANIQYDLLVREGNGTSFEGACDGLHSNSTWYWSPDYADFRLDCSFPQPDAEGECPWFYSLPINIWQYATQGRKQGREWHADPTGHKPYCETDKLDDGDRVKPFGSQYPFIFPPNSTYNGTAACPDDHKSNCQVWITPKMQLAAQDIQHFTTWWIRPVYLNGNPVSLPVRALISIIFDGLEPLCIDFANVLPGSPPEPAFSPPKFCASSTSSFLQPSTTTTKERSEMSMLKNLQ